MPRSNPNRNGTAILAVLWLTAALSAIAFSVADTVRAETERAISNQDSTRAYYLARGAVERVLFTLRNPEGGAGGTPAERFAGQRRLYFQEETGDTVVELISERGKLPLRTLNISLLQSLLTAIGEPPASAALIASQVFSGAVVDSQKSAGAPAFAASIASIENVEQLLLLPGITPEIAYGRYSRLPDGSLVNLGGLIDCVSPYIKESTGLDTLSVHPSLLVALGSSPLVAQGFARARSSAFDPAIALAAGVPINTPTRLDLGDVFQIRATGRPRLANGALSPTRRTVSLLIKFTMPNPRYLWLSPWTHLRWFDQAFSDVAASDSVWRTPAPAGARL